MVPLRGWGCGSLGKGATSILMDQTPKILFPLEQHSCIMLAASIPRLSHAGIRLVLWMCCYWLHKVRPSSWCLHRDAKRDSNKFARTQYDLRSLEGSPSKCQPGARIPARAGQSPPSGSVGGGGSLAFRVGSKPCKPNSKKAKSSVPPDRNLRRLGVAPCMEEPGWPSSSGESPGSAPTKVTKIKAESSQGIADADFSA